jgi:hypothetical protein
MKFLALGYYDPEAFEALDDDEKAALARRCAPHDEELRATGRMVASASLEHAAWRTLRPDDAGTSVTDGPFAETKEVVGSFFVVEADDLDEAVKIASLHPAARLGREMGFALELRPIERLEGNVG